MLFMFTKNILAATCLLAALFPLSFCVGGIEDCNGTKISERIKETRAKYVYVLPGNQVIINWTWCIAMNSTVTGIVIYRVYRSNSRIRLNHLLSMDLSKTVHYLKDNSRHELSSVAGKTSFEEKTVFIINNVTKTDSGAYSLHVRREGNSDLHSEVEVFIKTIDPTERLSLATAWNQTTKLFWTNSTADPQKRKSKNSATLIIVSTVVGSFAIIFMVIIIVSIFKWISRNGSRKRNLTSAFVSSDKFSLVKEEY